MEGRASATHLRTHGDGTTKTVDKQHKRKDEIKSIVRCAERPQLAGTTLLISSLNLCCFTAVVVASSSLAGGLALGWFQSSVPRSERPLTGTYLARDLSNLRAILSKLRVSRHHDLNRCFL